jgi:hypothetical protein
MKLPAADKSLTVRRRPRKYWNDLKKKVIAEGYVEVSEKIVRLKLSPFKDDMMTGETYF